MAYKYDRFGNREYGDPESDQTVMVWFWVPSKRMWAPKFCDRHFPTQADLIRRGTELHTTCVPGDLLVDNRPPTIAPKGAFTDRACMPWHETNCPGGITYQ